MLEGADRQVFAVDSWSALWYNGQIVCIYNSIAVMGRVLTKVDVAMRPYEVTEAAAGNYFYAVYSGYAVLSSIAVVFQSVS